ncbi:MAG: hypothetical protein IKN27_00055 [Selenomonadaceae bacterium]|nr:hypothetical protein [Selenomonadaceae bacterium]
MKNFTVRPEYPAHYGDHHYPPPPPPEPPKEVVRFAGESFTAMKAMQDEYGRSIPATYAEKNTVDDLKETVRNLSDKERDFSLTGDAEGSVKLDGKNNAAIQVTVKTSEKAVSDANGNNIAETYARADELANYIKRDEIDAKVDELERAALTGAKMITADCVKSSDLEFASDNDILRIFRWGRA